MKILFLTAAGASFVLGVASCLLALMLAGVLR